MAMHATLLIFFRVTHCGNKAQLPALSGTKVSASDMVISFIRSRSTRGGESLELFPVASIHLAAHRESEDSVRLEDCLLCRAHPPDARGLL